MRRSLPDLSTDYGRARAKRPEVTALFTICPNRRTFKRPCAEKPLVKMRPETGKRVNAARASGTCPPAAALLCAARAAPGVGGITEATVSVK